MRSRYAYQILGVFLLLLSVAFIYQTWEEDDSSDPDVGKKGSGLSSLNEVGDNSRRSTKRLRQNISRDNYKRVVDPISGKVLELEQIDLTAIDLGEYGHIMVVGNFVEDIRAVAPPDTTDLREFALSLPILESRTDHSYNHIFRNSQEAPFEKVWVMPSDGAQSPFKIHRLSFGTNGAQRIEVEKWLRRGKLREPYIHVTTLQRGAGGWNVVQVKLFKLKAQQAVAPNP